MIAGIIAEGARDFLVLEAVIKKLCPAIEEVLPIHPRTDELSASTITGWTGVHPGVNVMDPV